MQFIKNGPSVPETLLQAHEEGRVVFFCGAGISYPAGLPGFGGLVDGLYDRSGEVKTTVQLAAIKARQYDTAVGLLEELVGSREQVRRHLSAILTPNLTLAGATDTHRALLDLAKTRKGPTRLITTNFDKLFRHVIERDRIPVEQYRAPFIPVPKNRWSGIVYLHGELPEHPTATQLDELVLSSGDFGTAYLTERWAARFLSELFRSYVVCFVGYSLNDPVLRYMTDALAADRLRGERPIEIFAFASYQGRKQADIEDEWRAKNVVPILYKETRGHKNLHKTLQRWARTYVDGSRGKASIVNECVLAGPSMSTKDDDFIGRMLWALSDLEGEPAKIFAEHDPVPSLDWLECFGETRYEFRDLPRFGVDISPPERSKNPLRFSLLRRPSPYKLAPLMQLVGGGDFPSLDNPMGYLGYWLIHHLDDPALVLWVARQGGHLSDAFAYQIRERLRKTAGGEGSWNDEALDRLRGRAPAGIPRDAMRRLWDFVLAGKLSSPSVNHDIYSWITEFKKEGLTFSSKLKLRQLLSPRLRLSPSFSLEWTGTVEQKESRIKDLFHVEVVPLADYLSHAIKDLAESLEWQLTLPELLGDLYTALRDTLDLLREVGEAADKYDPGTWDLPSITPHWQNRHYHEWASLIELVRDAWVATYRTNPDRARQVARSFWTEPYPSFVRLALHAATYFDGGDRGEWVDWLISDDGYWLWTADSQREVCQLLTLSSLGLPEVVLSRLISSILNGPPRSMFAEDTSAEDFAEIVDHRVWLRLAKLHSAGVILGDAALLRLTLLNIQHPKWDFDAHQREEFSHWMSGTGDPDGGSFFRQTKRAPREIRPLIEWLKIPPTNGPFEEDDWTDVCRNRYRAAAAALASLAQQGVYPKQRWREAIQVWNNGPLVFRAWRHLGLIIANLPNDVWMYAINSLAFMLQEVGKGLHYHREKFFDLCEKVIDNSDPREIADDLVSTALNDPIGIVTQALTNWWFTNEPKDNQGLISPVDEIWAKLSDVSNVRFRNARLILCSNVIALFRVDSSWTQKHLLPLFDWSRSESEAQSAWLGYLLGPRLYRPLLTELKTEFLETVRHYEALGDRGSSYASMLTYAALDAFDVFPQSGLQVAIRALPQRGLEWAAQAVLQAQSSKGEQRAEYWSNRMWPFIEKIWPKAASRKSTAIALSFANLPLVVGDEFPNTVDALRPWLMPVQHLDAFLAGMKSNSLCERFPQAALHYIHLLVSNTITLPSKALQECLDTIRASKPELSDEDEFKALEAFCRKHF